MKRALLFVTAGVWLCTATASAQVARVFLSGTGSDAGDCTNAATPCRSLQAAIDQSPAGGEVIVLSSGGFGTANITKSITINAPDGVVAFNARTVTVNIAAPDKVTIRGVAMNGTVFGDNFGIYFIGGGTLVVEHSAIRGFALANIYSTNPAGKLFVKDCEITNSGSSGIEVFPTGVNTMTTVEDSRLANNHQSGFLIYDYARAVVRNTVSSNNFEGFSVLSTDPANAGSMMIDNCIASFNQSGLYAFGQGGHAQILVSDSTIFYNGNGMNMPVSGVGVSSIVTYGNNRVFLNTSAETFSGTATPF